MAKRLVGWGILVAGGIFCLISAVYADAPLKSAHYEIDESFVGGSGLVQSNSNNYQEGESIADTAIADAASAHYQTNGGYTTTSDPALSFAVNSSNANFGSFSAGGAATTTAAFQVSNYTSYGYVVQIVGNPPSNGSHTLPGMSTTGPSQTGVEQFGINLVANTSPASFGANPIQGLFGAGTADANYGTANNYRYVSGETIASAPKSSGVTTYTISYIVNVSSLTPGGQYGTNEVLVCTGTY